MVPWPDQIPFRSSRSRTRKRRRTRGENDDSISDGRACARDDGRRERLREYLPPMQRRPPNTLGRTPRRPMPQRTLQSRRPRQRRRWWWWCRWLRRSRRRASRLPVLHDPRSARLPLAEPARHRPVVRSRPRRSTCAAAQRISEQTDGFAGAGRAVRAAVGVARPAEGKDA